MKNQHFARFFNLWTLPAPGQRPQIRNEILEMWFKDD